MLYVLCHVRTVSLLLLAFATSSRCKLTCSEFVSPKELEVSRGGSVGISLPVNRNRKYRINQKCEWHVTARDSNDAITMTVESSSIQGRDVFGECNNDYVDVFDVRGSDENLLGRFCAKDSTQSYISSGPKMLIRFYSDYAFEFDGFSASLVATNKLENSPGNRVTVAVVSSVVLLVLFLLAGAVVTLVHRRRTTQRQRRRARHTQSTATPAADGGLGRSTGQPLPQYSRTVSPGEISATPAGHDPPPAYEEVAYHPSESETLPYHPTGLATLPSAPPSYDDVVKESGIS